MKRLLAALALGVMLSCCGAASASSPTLNTGFLDSGVSFGPTPAFRAEWLSRIRAEGANRIRIEVRWNRIAPKAPAPTDNASDPGWIGYDWTSIDTAVQESLATGLTPILSVHNAPAWAQQGSAPKGTPAGSWKPDPASLGAFAAALTRRYQGKVHYFQAWNEPNLDTYLAPQWINGKPYAPAHYREMLNAFYAAAKTTDPSNVVISAGTAPFGDPGRSGHRMRPALFVRTLLCLKDRALRTARCPDPAHFDVLDHHPYSVRGPDAPALNADDVCVPDLAKLSKPLTRAVATGRALPRSTKQLWTTEISWDSNPPDPDGIPAQQHARWLEEALHVLWKQGVNTVLWYQARDAPPTPSYAATYQSGVFELDGTPKPAATAFAFPFVAQPAGKTHVALWGKSPTPTASVTIQRLVHGRWITIVRLTSGSGAIFTRTTRGKRGWRMRAVSGGMASLSWTVRS